MTDTDSNHGATLGMTVLFTRDGGGEAFPAIVAGLFGHGGLNLCAFTPGPEPAWMIDYSATSKPRTWRHLPK